METKILNLAEFIKPSQVKSLNLKIDITASKFIKQFGKAKVNPIIPELWKNATKGVALLGTLRIEYLGSLLRVISPDGTKVTIQCPTTVTEELLSEEDYKFLYAIKGFEVNRDESNYPTDGESFEVVSRPGSRFTESNWLLKDSDNTVYFMHNDGTGVVCIGKVKSNS